MTLQQCTRADLLFVIDRMCRHSLNKWELEQALNDLAHEKEIARIEEAEKYAKLANDARKEHISTLAPYDGMKLLDVPMEVLKKADALQKQAAAADRKWAKLMREILFRGKRIDNDEWVEGFYYSYPPINRMRYWLDLLNHYGDADVIPETVGQYTGLTDKNGLKIFEGDIMEFNAYGMHYTGVVTIYKGNACILCGEKASPFLDDTIERRGALVIGNIHDNPDILKGGDEG